MSTLSDGLHQGSDREARPGWRVCCHCGCRPSSVHQCGFLTEERIVVKLHNVNRRRARMAFASIWRNAFC